MPRQFRQLPYAGKPEGVLGGGFNLPLRIPGAEGLFADHRLEGPVRLVARTGRHALFAQRPTELLTYHLERGGRILHNPLLRVRRGEAIDATLENRLGEDSTIHWHGLSVDERNDGSGMNPVRDGSTFRYKFEVLNRAGLYWYHPHPHDRTGAQVHLGLGSGLLVEDEREDELRRELGLDFGVTELPLVIQDKQVDPRYRIRYSMGEDDWIGNKVFVNWTPEPYLDAMTCLYRFRMLNASNARLYRLAFITAGAQLPFHLIGTDGGLLAAPQRVTELYLAPAQRADILVDFGKLIAGSTVMVRSLPYDPMENDDRGIDPSIEHPGAPLMGEVMDIMKINIKVPVCAPRSVPARLGPALSMPSTSAAARRFHMRLGGARWYINDYNFHDDMRAVKFRVKRGTTEYWDLRNDIKGMPHPMHVHGFQFRVVSRSGSPQQVRKLASGPRGLLAGDAGWTDTVLVWPRETVRIAIDFSQPFTGTQHYMIHCHNLEHEDQGMMMNFAVEA